MASRLAKLMFPDETDSTKTGSQYDPPQRPGKTFRDHRSGYPARRLSNQMARAEWTRSSNSTAANFPYHLCAGKGNSSKARKIKPGKRAKAS